MHRFAIAILVLSACAKHDAPAPTGGSATPSAAAASSGGGPCAAMRGDFQALISDPLTEVSGNPAGACNAYTAPGQPGFAGGALIFTDLAPHPFDPKPADAHDVAGVGDKAYWTSATRGPRLEAMKGKAQCELGTPKKATLKSTSDADQAAYVQLMGKVCNDMFAAQ